MPATRKVAKTVSKRRESQRADDFETVAKRLGCDPDLKAFDKNLGKIARTKTKADK